MASEMATFCEEQPSHHKQQQVCVNRPLYRQPKDDKAVKVYTVTQESRHILIFNVPSLGVTKDLLEQFSLYGEIEEYRLLDNYPCEEFTDVFYIRYRNINDARMAKRKLDNYYFFSKSLHVCYSPEYESINDVRYKLNQRKKIINEKSNNIDMYYFMLYNFSC
jgi:hypothetical protein